MKKNLKTSPRSTLSSQYLWGINISDIKIEGVIVNAKQPAAPLFSFSLEIDSFCAYDRLRGYEYIVGQVELLVTQLEKASGTSRPEKIGVAVPAIVDPSMGILICCNALYFNDQSLRSDLSAALKTEIILVNSVNCFALAEALLGAACEKHVVLGLNLGTGIGSGIVIGSRIIQGLHGIAGEWGHSIMQDEKTLCGCGKHGCNEMFFSRPALERFYEEITGEEISLQEILRRVDSKELVALQTLEHLQNKFAKAMAIYITLLDPDIIVIGGTVSNIDLLYNEETRSKISQRVFNKKLKTPILPSVLGKNAIVLGAALLCQSTQRFS